MRNHMPFDSSRRTLLVFGGALALDAALHSWPSAAPTNSNTKLPIGVIGSCHIGGTIGGLWVKSGHPVLFSSRHPEELKDLVAWDERKNPVLPRYLLAQPLETENDRHDSSRFRNAGRRCS